MCAFSLVSKVAVAEVRRKILNLVITSVSEPLLTIVTSVLTTAVPEPCIGETSIVCVFRDDELRVLGVIAQLAKVLKSVGDERLFRCASALLFVESGFGAKVALSIGVKPPSNSWHLNGKRWEFLVHIGVR